MIKMGKNEIDEIRKSKKTDPEINLYILLDQADSIITNAIELEIKHLRVTQPQVRVLNMLSRVDKPTTLEELASQTFKEFNSVSTLINRMEKKGFIKKVKKPGELKTYVVLTEKGSDLYHKQVSERSIHLIFNELTTNEKQQLDSILTKIRDKARDLMGLGYRPPFLH
jgi:DNA-binding MarR family transcriptional regulator